MDESDKKARQFADAFGNQVETILGFGAAEQTVTTPVYNVGGTTFNQRYDHDGRGLLAQVFASPAATMPTAAEVSYTYRPSGQVQERQFSGEPLVPLRYTIREQLDR